MNLIQRYHHDFKDDVERAQYASKLWNQWHLILTAWDWLLGPGASRKGDAAANAREFYRREIKYHGWSEDTCTDAHGYFKQRGPFQITPGFQPATGRGKKPILGTFDFPPEIDRDWPDRKLTQAEQRESFEQIKAKLKGPANSIRGPLTHVVELIGSPSPNERELTPDEHAERLARFMGDEPGSRVEVVPVGPPEREELFDDLPADENGY